MGRVTRKLLLLLAMAVVAQPLRAAWHGHSVRTAHDGHVHLHVHDHGGVTEAHSHYHHHGESHDGDHHGGPDHHDGVLDHGESGPTVFWTAPAITQVDAPPPIPRAAAVAATGMREATPLLRARPPPWSRGHHQHLDLVAITVLRL